MESGQQSTSPSERELTVRDFQRLIKEMFGAKDAARGIDGTFMWLMEEIGELASELRAERSGQPNDREALASEFADVLAWVVTLANVAEIDLTDAIHQKYGEGCPRCFALICQCDLSRKP